MAIINPEWIIKQEGSFQTAEEMNVLASAVKNNAVELQTDVNNLSAHVNNKANPHEVTKIQLDLENVDNVSDANKPVSIAQAAAIAAIQADFDSHEADKANPHQVTKTQIGLSEADNTSDINKPVSTAQQIILDNKINLNGLNSNIDKLHFNPTTLTQLSSIGDVRYSLESKTIEVKVSDTVSIQLGQEMQTVVKNDAGVQINNGQLVYVNSAIDTNALAKIASTTDADISQRTFGMATENIATNEFGSITTEGLVRGLNTVAFSEGTMLYLGVNGAFTGTEPTAPTSKISVGMVIRSHETEGVVYVKIRAIARNQKLSDVYAPIMTNGDILRWNNSTLRFETFNITSALNTKENISNKGIVNGYASLDNSGKIPVTQLPSYVDDVLEYASLIDFPVVGESNKIYIALDTNKTYRWSGSTYVYITSGAVDSVAGKTGIVTLDKTDVGLPNADNTSDINKPISTATQTALNLKTNQTRSIISGSGLTGGGDLSTDRTLNVSSANDGITVNVDNIQLNAVNNVTSTSITQPLAANQGKILNDNLTQLGADLNQLTPKDTEEEGFYICDKNGNVLIRLDILDTKGGIGSSLTFSIKSLIESTLQDGVPTIEASAIGASLSATIANYISAHSAEIADIIEDGFYISDENGNVVAEFINDKWVFLGIKTDAIQEGYLRKTGNLSSGNTWTLGRNSVKNNKRMVFSGTIGAFSTLTIGHGTSGNYLASWIVVDAVNVVIHNYTSSDTTLSYAHGLTIANNIQVEIWKELATTTLKIVSMGNTFQQSISWNGDHGDIYVTTDSTLTDCSFSWTCSKMNNGIWMFGDSYFSLNAGDRWPYYLIQDGFTNWVQNAYSGANSVNAYLDLIDMLKISTPKKIIWCMGMNDNDSTTAVNTSWESYYDSVKALCIANNIELILATIPTAVGGIAIEDLRINKFKNSIVRASGYRYIEFEKAVGANETTGEWYSGMLSSDNIHPTALGAKTLYQRAICDCPELMQ